MVNSIILILVTILCLITLFITMPSCAAINCTNRKTRGSGKTFHLFPHSKPELFKKWVIKMKRDKFYPSKTAVLCSDHFEEEFFDRTGQTVRLRDGAIPTKFIFPKHLMKPPPKQRKPRKIVLPDSTPVSRTVKPGSGPEEQLVHSKRHVVDHNYYIKDSPKSLKRKLNNATDHLERVKKRLKFTQQKTRRLHKRVVSLQNVVTELREKQLISNGGADLLEKTFSGVSLEIMNRIMQQNKKGKRVRKQYSPVLRSFALTLQFYSTKAYEYVRKTFNLALPHQSAIRSWYQGISGEPGFTDEAFKALQARVQHARTTENKEIVVSLMIDEMAIKKHVEWGGKQFYGFVDIGTHIEDDTVPVASEALVFMAVCLNENWKIPLGYFLIVSLPGAERANLVKQCLLKLHDVGVKTTSVTCDGPSCHFTMFNELGASLTYPNLVPYFEHPADASNVVYVMLDICHMLKLTRNTLASYKVLKDMDGGTIKWKYIEELHRLQQSEGLRLGNKLKSAHLMWEKQKMKVNLAAQTLSSSVADAIDFCRDDLNINSFEGSEATVKFIRVFDRLFDLMNSRNPLAKGFKAPMRNNNHIIWSEFLGQSENYISQLKSESGELLVKGRRKTPFIGFLVAIQSVSGIFDSLVHENNSPLKYLLTYKLSQDHLELFFGAVRASCGSNNNPTVRQFVAAYKRLLIRHEIKGSAGNCTVQDNTSILYVTRDTATLNVNGTITDTLNVSMAKRYNFDEFVEDDEGMEACVAFQTNLSQYKEAAIGYISGYVVRMVRHRIKCPTCISALVADQPIKYSSFLLNRKNRGGLVMPSESVIKVCEATEKCFQHILNINDGNIPQVKGIVPSITSAVLSEVALKAVFDSIYFHMLDSTPESNHIYTLIKCVSGCYCKIRMHHFAKSFTEKITGQRVRKQLSKLILFKHQ